MVSSVYQTGQDEHKIDVPVSWLPTRESPFKALQRPSSVGIRPVEYLIERFSADGLLVYHHSRQLFSSTITVQSEQKMLSGQFDVAQIEMRHCRAEAEFRRNGACEQESPF